MKTMDGTIDDDTTNPHKPNKYTSTYMLEEEEKMIQKTHAHQHRIDDQTQTL
jgi:hypothetical protein